MLTKASNFLWYQITAVKQVYSEGFILLHGEYWLPRPYCQSTWTEECKLLKIIAETFVELKLYFLKTILCSSCVKSKDSLVTNTTSSKSWVLGLTLSFPCGVWLWDTGLRLTPEPMLALNLWSCCLSLQSAAFVSVWFPCLAHSNKCPPPFFFLSWGKTSICVKIK